MNGRADSYYYDAILELSNVSIWNVRECAIGCFSVFKSIVDQPYRFFDGIDTHDSYIKDQATKYGIYTLVAIFLLIIPVVLLNTIGMSHAIMIGESVLAILFFSAFIHMAIRMMGFSEISFSENMTMCFYVFMTILPIIIISQYPILLRFGLEAHLLIDLNVDYEYIEIAALLVVWNSIIFVVATLFIFISYLRKICHFSFFKAIGGVSIAISSTVLMMLIVDRFLINGLK